MSQCTCIKDKEMTCIVHPTTRNLKDYIAEQAAEIKRLKAVVDAAKFLAAFLEYIEAYHESGASPAWSRDARLALEQAIKENDNEEM
tara:strand:- start:160 stop:420 length:261 start_codon:yes stop_codon:yes gene_type:complete